MAKNDNHLHDIANYIAEAELALQRKAIDSKEATTELIKVIDSYLTTKSISLDQRSDAARELSRTYAEKHVELAENDLQPFLEKGMKASTRADAIKLESEQLANELNITSDNLRKSQILEMLKIRNYELELCEKELIRTENALYGSQSRTNDLIPIIEAAWQPLESIKFIPFKVTTITGIMIVLDKAIRVIFVLLALSLTLAFDKLTPLLDSLFKAYDAKGYHLITILIFFLIQLRLFDHYAAKLAKYIYWKYYAKLLTRFKLINNEMEEAETKMQAAEGILTKLGMRT